MLPKCSTLSQTTFTNMNTIGFALRGEISYVYKRSGSRGHSLFQSQIYSRSSNFNIGLCVRYILMSQTYRFLRRFAVNTLIPKLTTFRHICNVQYMTIYLLVAKIMLFEASAAIACVSIRIYCVLPYHIINFQHQHTVLLIYGIIKRNKDSFWF